MFDNIRHLLNVNTTHLTFQIIYINAGFLPPSSDSHLPSMTPNANFGRLARLCPDREPSCLQVASGALLRYSCVDPPTSVLQRLYSCQPPLDIHFFWGDVRQTRRIGIGTQGSTRCHPLIRQLGVTSNGALQNAEPNLLV